ncbi:MAG TPA: T9SS type A sorting domain-containing protein [Bacteroidia bacterium]|nr:T9SS type A sorting domain-containing protein [Bacteroidia bacterium]
MKKLTLLATISLSPLFTEAQTLGGYTIYDHLVTAIHPYGCSPGYVTHLPDDSIWVNFFPNDSMTGNFSMPGIDAGGDDLLLETGFHPSNYAVCLLLSNGQYSTSHNITLSDWVPLSDTTWYYAFTNCLTGGMLAPRYIVALDFNLDFGLTASDTVTGIKIIFFLSAGETDFAGAYIINPQSTGINEHASKPELYFSPNPFSDKINITIINNELSEFSLYDIASRKLIQQKFTNSVSINTAQLSKGIYIYEVSNKNGIIKKGKVVKE